MGSPRPSPHRDVRRRAPGTVSQRVSGSPCEVRPQPPQRQHAKVRRHTARGTAHAVFELRFTRSEVRNGELRATFLARSLHEVETMNPRPAAFTAFAVALAVLSGAARAQHGAPPNGEWLTYGGDLGNTRYS